MLTVRTSENTVITSFRLITERQDFSSVRTGENTVRARARIHRRKVNISEVKRRLSVSESAAAQIRQPNSLDVINLCEGEADEESTLSISAKGMTFEFKTQRPEESVIFILSRMRGDVI